jgi:hypothetical protein
VFLIVFFAFIHSHRPYALYYTSYGIPKKTKYTILKIEEISDYFYLSCYIICKMLSLGPQFDRSIKVIMNKWVSCSCFSHTFKVSMLCSLIFAIFIFPKNFMSIQYVFWKKILNQLVNSVKFGLGINIHYLELSIC